MNKINIPLMLDLLRRGTCNYSIDNIGIRFNKDTYKIGMRGPNSIIMLNGENDIISNILDNDTWDLNFSMTSKNIKPYFDLIISDECDECDIKHKEEKLVLNSGSQKVNLFFCSDTLISRFDGTGPKTTGDTLYECEIDQSFIDTYQLIKKVASSFGKIYFNVFESKFSMEATDKTNSFSNGMKIDIQDTDYDDINLCFDFKVFNNIMTLINGDYEDFTFRVGYIKKNSGGMISFIKNDGTETYYMLSTRENS